MMDVVVVVCERACVPCDGIAFCGLCTRESVKVSRRA